MMLLVYLTSAFLVLGALGLVAIGWLGWALIASVLGLVLILVELFWVSYWGE
jgi:uncharacterized membrane protein YuzA (DUF378 family)